MPVRSAYSNNGDSLYFFRRKIGDLLFVPDGKFHYSLQVSRISASAISH